jgi:hypothetical protein
VQAAAKGDLSSFAADFGNVLAAVEARFGPLGQRLAVYSEISTLRASVAAALRRPWTGNPELAQAVRCDRAQALWHNAEVGVWSEQGAKPRDSAVVVGALLSCAKLGYTKVLAGPLGKGATQPAPVADGGLPAPTIAAARLCELLDQEALGSAESDVRRLHNRIEELRAKYGEATLDYPP